LQRVPVVFILLGHFTSICTTSTGGFSGILHLRDRQTDRQEGQLIYYPIYGLIYLYIILYVGLFGKKSYEVMVHML
jgi:hypothetical protein